MAAKGKISKPWLEAFYVGQPDGPIGIPVFRASFEADHPGQQISVYTAHYHLKQAGRVVPKGKFTGPRKGRRKSEPKNWDRDLIDKYVDKHAGDLSMQKLAKFYNRVRKTTYSAGVFSHRKDEFMPPDWKAFHKADVAEFLSKLPSGIIYTHEMRRLLRRHFKRNVHAVTAWALLNELAPERALSNGDPRRPSVFERMEMLATDMVPRAPVMDLAAWLFNRIYVMRQS